jgi:unsaturated chondroitin disaccharide hydrolase
MSYAKALECAIKKTENNIKEIGLDLREFVACHDGMYFKEPREQYIKLSHIFNWTQSFFTGMAYWSYKITKDEKYLKWLYSFCDEYYKKVFETPFETMHDTGFLYTPYAVALYKLTGDPNMKKIGVKAADELAKRFVPNGGFIRAWGRMDDNIPKYVDSELAKNHFFTESKGLVIIDCMMNLPLLFWASEVTGNPYYKRIATMHADTTLKYFVREDNSVCHAYRFNEETGEPIGVENYCGYDKESHWARGTSWAIYGFAIAFAYTKKEEYLDTAVKLAKKFIALCEEDGMPVWDFRLPKDKPAMYCGKKQDWINWDIGDAENRKYNLDTSAAAITVCGIYEILKHNSDYKLSNAADKMLNTLAEKYIDYSLDTNGLLKCQNGSMTYTSFGDYYFMEALSKKLYDYERIW